VTRWLSRAARVNATLALVLAACSAAPGAAPAQDAAGPFASCDAAGPQWSYDELLCFNTEGRRLGRLPEARARLRQLGAGEDGHPWATLVLAHATLADDEPEAVRHYEGAARGFARTGEAEGEVIARLNLRIIYHRRGASEAAAEQVRLALAAAEASGAPLTIARASVLEAGHVLDTGGDVGRAHRALLRAERLAFPGAPIGLRRTILFTLANASLYLGRLDEAIDALERHRALRAEDGSTVDAAAVAFNLLNARVTREETRPSAAGRARLAALAEQVVRDTQTLGRPYTESQAHRLLGELLRPTDPSGARRHLLRCLELEAPLGYPDVRASCLWSLARSEASLDADRAERLSREAIALVSKQQSGPALAYAWQARLRLAWQVLPPEQAIAESMEALRAIERLRAAQRDEGSRAALFGSWTRDYYWLAGRLLNAHPARLDQAFEVGERLRARVLLDHLARAGVTPTADAGSPLRGETTARIVETQRRLLDASLTAAQRAALADHLALLELERTESSDATVTPAGEPSPSFASLAAVQQALGAHEALLWYSLAPWVDLYGDFGGGSWALAITRDAVKVHRLDLRVDVDSQVAALDGLLQQRHVRSSAWSAAAQRLGRSLLGGVIASLPDSVAQLVIASDGALHRLPFEVLQPDADARALGERYEVSVVPSATIWLHLRRAPARPAAGTSLVLGDPDVSNGSPDGEQRLTPLPWARREAIAIGELLGPDLGTVHVGREASERRLKQSVSGARVVHLAAHARADAAFPDRSAVFLSPGSDAEDGWLQPREIAALDLRGALVVLSACESARGALLSGEGPLSLARAFFAGGAGAVVATRWPLRDDDAAFVMERFYRALSSGTSIGGALLQARRDAIEAGRPAAAWAGVALLGDGVAAPVAPRAPAHRSPVALMAVAAALALAGWLIVGVRRR
jgi:CHAT domain-containing protein